MYRKHFSTAAPALVFFLFSFLCFGGAAAPASASGTVVNPRAIAISPDSHWLYAAEPEGVAIIDATTNLLVKLLTFDKVGMPDALAVSPDGALLYGSDAENKALETIDLTTDQVAAQVSLGKTPGPLGLSPDGMKAYVLGQDSTLTVVNLKAGQVVAAIPVGPHPTDLVVQPDGSRVYVSIAFPFNPSTNSSASQVAVIDTATNTVAHVIPLSSRPDALAISPNGRELYVTHSDPADRAVDVISTESLKEVRALRTGSAAAVAVSPDSKRLYFVANSLNLVAAIDLASSQVVSVSQPVSLPGVLAVNQPPLPPLSLVASPDGRRLYLGELVPHTIAVIDAGTLQWLGAIELPHSG